MSFLARVLRIAGAALLLACCAVVPGAKASTIFVIGSDVIGLHGDTEFIKPVFIQLAGSPTPSLPVLFVNDYGRSSLTGATVPLDFKAPSFINAAGTTAASLLAAYSAIYFDSPGSCCNDPGGSVAASAAKIAAFVAGGGNLGIGNYQGNATWDTALGFTGAAGVTGGAPSALCEDPGVSTASGITFGFKPSYTEGCFVHQTYSPAFWTSHGYFALQTDGATGPRFGNFVTMATGFVEPGTTPGVPEPGSLALLGAALAGIFMARRRYA